jgi:hypothetical protein
VGYSWQAGLRVQLIHTLTISPSCLLLVLLPAEYTVIHIN